MEGYLTERQIQDTKHLSSRKAAQVLGAAKTTVNKYRAVYAGDYVPPDLPNAKILTIDIESKPHKAYVWGHWDQNIPLGMVIEDGGMICFAAKWLGSDEIVFYSDFADGHEGMVRAAHKLLSEADIVVGYNSDRYDIKRLNNEFLALKMAPPRPYRSIDLFKVNKKQFDLPSKKLDYLAQFTDNGSKVKHEGFGLWVACMANDPEAWARMEEYNRGDVIVTEKTYISLLPWLTNVPHMGMFVAKDTCCPYCGSEDIIADGEVKVLVQTYALFHCNNCEGWSRGNKPLASTITTRRV